MPEVNAGDLVAIQTAGAYGFVLSSNYNSRPRACELLVDGTQVLVARAAGNLRRPRSRRAQWFLNAAALQPRRQSSRSGSPLKYFSSAVAKRTVLICHR